MKQVPAEKQFLMYRKDIRRYNQPYATQEEIVQFVSRESSRSLGIGSRQIQEEAYGRWQTSLKFLIQQKEAILNCNMYLVNMC